MFNSRLRISAEVIPDASRAGKAVRIEITAAPAACADVRIGGQDKLRLRVQGPVPGKEVICTAAYVDAKRGVDVAVAPVVGIVVGDK